jgi:hypothetical protein
LTKVVLDNLSEMGDLAVQTAQPRDLGALALVIGLLLILLVVTLIVGAPVAR